MKHHQLITLLLALGLLAGAGAWAEEGDPVDDTMIVVDEDTTPEDVVNVLELPEVASEIAADAAGRGLETATQARGERRAFGERQAETAREQGQAFGREQAEAARERAQAARETAGESARDQAQEHARELARPDRTSDERPTPPVTPPTP